MSPRSPFLAVMVAAFLLFATPAAKADLGVEDGSRSSGAPGEKVRLTVGCGACSAIGVETPPASFPISLVPVDRVPKPHPCGPDALCPPRVRAVPQRPPFTYLGEARLRRGEKDRAILRYVLDFAIPRLPAGAYTYVIYCDYCADGRAGSLVTEPNANGPWRLRIRP
jgi:hypothetical protein